MKRKDPGMAVGREIVFMQAYKKHTGKSVLRPYAASIINDNPLNIENSSSL